MDLAADPPATRGPVLIIGVSWYEGPAVREPARPENPGQLTRSTGAVTRHGRHDRCVQASDISVLTVVRDLRREQSEVDLRARGGNTAHGVDHVQPTRHRLARAPSIEIGRRQTAEQQNPCYAIVPRTQLQRNPKLADRHVRT